MISKNKKLLNQEILKSSIKGAFIKLNPAYMMKNPVMFVVEVGFTITLILSIFPNLFGTVQSSSQIYNIIVTLILFLTILFANFAESVAEGRGKAQAESLKKTQKNMKARIINKDKATNQIKETIIDAIELKKDDIVLVKAGELIPSDGEVIEGIVSFDESAITGESAPVVKESGGDFASVTGGTTVSSDWLKIKITSSSGESFLDKMISLVEGASRKKTPNEIALNTLLVSLTIIFLIVIVTRFNVIAMSGKAVEASGDVDTMILDKTGTITFGNRMAAKFLPVNGVSLEELTENAVLTSLKDETPEGKSIIRLAEEQEDKDFMTPAEMTFVEFTAQTRMSGVDFPTGKTIRKGATDAVIDYIQQQGGGVPNDLKRITDEISSVGGTPLVVSEDSKILGVIYLKDTIKPGLVERFARLREMGIKTIMCTGDNPLTAATIAQEAGVDSYIAECKPEDKIKAIKVEQNDGKVVAMTGDGTNDAPALAQADVGIAMNSGTSAAKEAANMVDLDSDPTKILDIVEIGKQLLITRGALTTFSIANDIAKYFAIIPAMFMLAIPQIHVLNIMNLATPSSAILSALIFNAIIIPLLIPLAMKGVKYKPQHSDKMLTHNMLVYGLGGVIAPFIGIKIIDLIIAPLLHMIGL